MHKKNDLLFVCTLVCTHSQIPNKHSGPNKWIKLSISLNTINGQALINEKGGCFCVEKSFNTCEWVGNVAILLNAINRQAK